MNDLFNELLFPSSRKERGADPGPFAEHRSYKPHLQREFRRKCIYCRVADGLKGDESFGVDHYLPKSKFPALAVVWQNLFYACNLCNTWKGDSVSTPQLFLPNPCEHQMADHLQYRGAEIVAYTSHGEWLVELLHLRERRGLREFILSALGKFLEAHKELVDDLTFYGTRLNDTQEVGGANVLKAAIRETTEELESIDNHIERLIGCQLVGG